MPQDKEIEWEDYGESSLTILSSIVGIKKKEPNIPLDPSDFKRCIHLLQCLPKDSPDDLDIIKKTSEIYPIWKPYYDNWDKMVKLYLEETKQETSFSKAPKLYKFMQELKEKKECMEFLK